MRDDPRQRMPIKQQLAMRAEIVRRIEVLAQIKALRKELRALNRKINSWRKTKPGDEGTPSQ